MKVSKSLLQAILVGVTLGAGATACELESDKLDPRKEQLCEEHGGDCTGGHEGTYDNCPACGLG